MVKIRQHPNVQPVERGQIARPERHSPFHRALRHEAVVVRRDVTAQESSGARVVREALQGERPLRARHAGRPVELNAKEQADLDRTFGVLADRVVAERNPLSPQAILYEQREALRVAQFEAMYPPEAVRVVQERAQRVGQQLVGSADPARTWKKSHEVYTELVKPLVDRKLS